MNFQNVKPVPKIFQFPTNNKIQNHIHVIQQYSVYFLLWIVSIHEVFPGESTEQLVAKALNSNPEIAYYKLEIQAAIMAAKNSGKWQDPEISGSIGHVRSSGGGQSKAEGLAWSVGVMQNFEWPGRRNLRRVIADGDIILAQLGLRSFEFALSAKVRSLSHQLAAASQKAFICNEVAQRYRSLRETLIQRDLTGITPGLEIRILEATEISLRQTAIQASQAESELEEELNFLLGNPAGTKLNIEIQKTELPEIPSLETLLSKAHVNNFELLQARERLNQQGLYTDLTRNLTKPSISVGPQMSDQNGQSKDTTIGIGVSISLPLWRYNQNDIEISKTRELQSQTLLELVVRKLNKEVSLTSNRYIKYKTELEHWDSSIVEKFSGSALLADEHYRLGAVNSSTYIEMQKQYLDAVETHLNGQLAAIQALSELEELTGIQFIGVPSIQNELTGGQE